MDKYIKHKIVQRRYAFTFFAREYRDLIRQEPPHLSFFELNTYLYNIYIELSPNERQVYIDQTIIDCKRYFRERAKNTKPYARPKNAYIYFVSDSEVRKTFCPSETDPRIVMRILGQKWRNEISSWTKEKYNKLARQDKKRYHIDQYKYETDGHSMQEHNLITKIKKPRTPFEFFANDSTIYSKYSGHSHSRVEYIASIQTAWLELSDNIREKYNELYDTDVKEYDLEKKKIISEHNKLLYNI